MRNSILYHFTLFILFFIFLAQGNSQIYINEFMASNSVTISDEFGEFDDWVEIYNTGNTPVNLADYYWTDDLNNLTLSQIPSTQPSLTTVPANGFLLFWFDKDTEQGENHVNAKLSAGGEDLALIASDGLTIIDSYTFGSQLVDVSEGRVPDGGSSFDFYGEPTPSTSNNTTAGATMVALPTVDIVGGHYNGNVSVSLSTTTPDAVIHYTLDGSEPTLDSPEYSSPITISEVKSLRARGFLSDVTPSNILTETYLIDISHIFPIVCLTGEPDDFFGDNGIVPNYAENIEIPVNIEFFDTDGTLGFNQVIGVEVSGTASASFDQKSFALKAKGSFGDATFSYPIFPTQDKDSYRSLILRNSGNDWSATFFRDAAVTSLTRDVSDVEDIIDPPQLYDLDYRPVITYLNGEYYGIYNMRERADRRYIKTHFDLDEDEIDFIENKDVVKEGDILAWDSLQLALETTDYSIEENYNLLAQDVDVDHYIDYLVIQLFADNQDWPGNNNRRFRTRTADGKWRWILYDLDFSFGIFTDAGWNTGSAEDNSLERIMNPSEYSHPNPEWSARLFNNLLENEGWRTKLINRMADQINILFQPERISARIDNFYDSYLPEREQSQDLWGNFWGHYEDVQILKEFGEERIPVVYEDFEDAFDEISGIAEISIDAIPADKGRIDFNTVHLDEDDFSWTGTYFEGVPIPVVAVPNAGYVLDHWSGDLSGDENSETLTLDGDATITAHFELGSTSTAGILINEINYNSGVLVNSGDWVEFYNPTNEDVDISGWYFQDEEGGQFIFPANTIIESNGFLVLVEDYEAEFNVFYPNVSPVMGDFGDATIFTDIKISNGGELLSLFNANGVLIDAVDYNDNSPWVTTPDGFGASLQLASPSLDNSLAENWAGWEPTPGAINSSENLINQTIDFPSIGDKYVNDVPFQISATASSNLVVSFTVLSGPATAFGNTLVLSGQTGTVTIQAAQIGNAIYNPAATVIQSFEVLPIPLLSQSIDFPSLSDKFIDDLAFDISATASSNLEVTFSILSGPATLSGNTITLTEETGTVIIEASQNGNDEYQPAENVSQSFEVLPKPLLDQNITFGEISDKYANEIPFTLTASANSGLEVVFTVISGPATVSGNIITLSGELGAVAIEASQAGNDFYNPAQNVYQSFNILEVPLLDQSIDFPTIENKLTDDLPFEINAFATSGLDVQFDVLSGPASIVDNIVTLSGEVGTVTIQASQSGNDIYNSAPSVIQSFEVLDPAPVEYCTPNSNLSSVEWIGNVSFAGVSHSSSSAPYSNFTDIIIPVEQEESYSISLTTRYSYFSFLENWKVWIDYNHNYVFEESEVVFFSTLSPPPHGTLIASISGNITIPLNTEIGETRMRVSMSRNAFASSCGPMLFGEYEDYTIDISASDGIIDNPPSKGYAPMINQENLNVEDLDLAQSPSQFETKNVNVFPNPTSEYLFISSIYGGKEVKIELLDVLGRNVKSTFYDKLPFSSIEMRVENLEAGVYFIRLTVEGEDMGIEQIVVE